MGEMNVTLDSRNGANVLAIFLLGGGSFLLGLLPTCISSRNRNRYPLVMSILLCFGAGVLLSTSIVHMLSDVSSMLSDYVKIHLHKLWF